MELSFKNSLSSCLILVSVDTEFIIVIIIASGASG